MHIFSFPQRSLVLAAVITVASLSPLLAADVDVVDPTTGETVALSEVEFDTLTEEQRADIRDQLAEQGIQPRGRGRLADVEVTDPTTGETVALGDIDRESLSEEDRENIGAQLADQGFTRGRADDESDSGASVEDDTAEAANSDSGIGGRGRGGEGRGGRGGPRG